MMNGCRFQRRRNGRLECAEVKRETGKWMEIDERMCRRCYWDVTGRSLDDVIEAATRRSGWKRPCGRG